MLSLQRNQPPKNPTFIPLAETVLVVKWWSHGGHVVVKQKSLPVFAGQGREFGRGDWI